MEGTNLYFTAEQLARYTKHNNGMVFIDEKLQPLETLNRYKTSKLFRLLKQNSICSLRLTKNLTT